MTKEEKIRYELVPDEFMDVALVFMAGIKEGYEPNGWKEGKKFEKETNIASIKRHLRDYRAGLRFDKDSGLHPLLHAATRCLMQYYLDLKSEQNTSNNIELESLDETDWLDTSKAWKFDDSNCRSIEEHFEIMKNNPSRYYKREDE